MSFCSNHLVSDLKSVSSWALPPSLSPHSSSSVNHHAMWGHRLLGLHSSHTHHMPVPRRNTEGLPGSRRPMLVTLTAHNSGLFSLCASSTECSCLLSVCCAYKISWAHLCRERPECLRRERVHRAGMSRQLLTAQSPGGVHVVLQ